MVYNTGSVMMRFLKGIGIFLALIGVGVASAFAVIALLLHQEEVRVPDLAGKDIVAVIETLNQLGLQLKVDGREPNATLPRDTVVSQSPAPESGIKKGRQVHVVVSQGPSDLLAPNVVGEHFRKADIMVRQAGFRPGDISQVYSDSADRGVVMAQYPQSGSPIEKGGTIGMLVSSGKKPDILVMPRLVGKKTEEALRIVDRLELQHRVISRPGGNWSPGMERTVIGQKPRAGYPVSAEATVDIVVNR
jgi:eukaryotic-like serine/threonine-protein kinase